MRVSGDLAATVNEPVSIVDIESLICLLKDLQQQIFIIGSSCREQPLIWSRVVLRCVNARAVSSTRDVLLDAPSEAMFKEVEAKRRVWG